MQTEGQCAHLVQLKCVRPAASNVTFHVYQRETQTHVLREVVSQESPKVPVEEEGTAACCVPVPAPLCSCYRQWGRPICADGQPLRHVVGPEEQVKVQQLQSDIIYVNPPKAEPTPPKLPTCISLDTCICIKPHRERFGRAHTKMVAVVTHGEGFQKPLRGLFEFRVFCGKIYIT